MKISELIAELQKWPESDVMVCRQITPPGGDFAYHILGVTGSAGGAIDGSDSSVTLEISESAYKDSE